jgi:ubiquinone/menaquinone biosynthesis C-methylase UbiE
MLKVGLRNLTNLGGFRAGKLVRMGQSVLELKVSSMILFPKRHFSANKEDEPIDWARMAANYDVIVPFTRLFSSECIKLLDIPKDLRDNRVLDIAAGTGSFALEVATKVESGIDGCIIATDLSQEMINILAFKASKNLTPEKLKMISCLQMNGQELKVQSNSISHIGCVFGAMFFADRIKAFSEMHRVLKNGGAAAIAVWQTINLPALMQDIVLCENKITRDQLPMPFLKMATSCQDATVFTRDIAAAGFGARCVEVRSEERSCTLATDDIVGVFASNPSCGGLGISAETIRRYVTSHADADGPDRFVARGTAHIAIARKE